MNNELIAVPNKSVNEMGKKAKQLLNRVEEAEVYKVHPLHRMVMEEIHPYKGLGYPRPVDEDDE